MCYKTSIGRRKKEKEGGKFILNRKIQRHRKFILNYSRSILNRKIQRQRKFILNYSRSKEPLFISFMTSLKSENQALETGRI